MLKTTKSLNESYKARVISWWNATYLIWHKLHKNRTRDETATTPFSFLLFNRQNTIVSLSRFLPEIYHSERSKVILYTIDFHQITSSDLKQILLFRLFTQRLAKLPTLKENSDFGLFIWKRSGPWLQRSKSGHLLFCFCCLNTVIINSLN